MSGYYVGGADDLSLLVESGGLSELLSGAKATPAQKVPYEPTLLKRSSTPDLCHVPKIRGAWYPNWPVYSFQWTMSSNLVRYISTLHLIIMGVTLPLIGPYPAVADALLLLFFVDLCLLVIFGPVPSLTGTISTYFGWQIRGNATSSLPYKVVFAAYIYTLHWPVVSRCFGGFPGWDADSSKYLRNSYAGFITNSALLAYFR